MKAKDFIKQLKKLKKNQSLELGDYTFYKQNKLFNVFNKYTGIIENRDPYESAEEVHHVYRFVVYRFEEKPRTNKKVGFFSDKFRNKKEFKNESR